MERIEKRHTLEARVYKDLCAVAESRCRSRPIRSMLNPAEVVHEVCIELMRQGLLTGTSTQRFRAIAIHKIGQVIADQMKRRQAQKRGGPPRWKAPCQTQTAEVGFKCGDQPWRRVSIDRVMVEGRDQSVDLLDLAEAVAELGRNNRRLRYVLFLHWFNGLPHAEVAELVGVSQSTAEKDFRRAIIWLQRRFQRASGDAG